jgi:hypothetical protein
MLRDGTAHLSECSWFSALHIVPKNDNGSRSCGDNGALNARIIPDRYPVGYIHDYTHKLFNCSIFSKTDLMRAYNKISVHLYDIWKTAINTSFGRFEFLFMFFGLCNAAHTIQSFMDDI